MSATKFLLQFVVAKDYHFLMSVLHKLVVNQLEPLENAYEKDNDRINTTFGHPYYF